MERVKLVRLNEVQFADTAERMADLVFAGFEPVNEKKAEEPKAVEEPSRRSRKTGDGLNGRRS